MFAQRHGGLFATSPPILKNIERLGRHQVEVAASDRSMSAMERFTLHQRLLSVIA